MKAQDAKNAFANAKPLLLVVNQLVEAVEYAAEIEKEVKTLEAKRAAEDRAYQQAHGEHAQLVQDIVRLKEQYSQLGQDLAKQYAEAQANFAEAMSKASTKANEYAVEVQRIAQEQARVAVHKAERAEAELAEVEARVDAAKTALDALKRA
jgi:uncharacterized protein (UPF0335 family)